MKYSFVEFWKQIINSKSNQYDEITLNVVSFVISALFIVLTIGNYLILQSLALTLVSFLVFAVLAFAYYLNRIAKKRFWSLVIFITSVYIFQAVIYWYNGGKLGPGILTFFLSFQILITITPVKTHKFWLLLHITSVLAIYWAEMNYGHTLPIVYTIPEQRIADLSFSYIVVIGFVFVLLLTLVNNLKRLVLLNKEKHLELETIQEQLTASNQSLIKQNQNKASLFGTLSSSLKEPFRKIEHTFQKSLRNNQTLNEQTQNELLELTESTNILLTNILYWSKIQLNQVPVQVKEFKLNDFTKVELRSIIQRAVKKGKNINFTLSNLEVTTSDRIFLGIILSNCIDACLQHTKNSEPIEVTINARIDFLYISVHDTGASFKNEELVTLLKSQTNSISENKLQLALQVALKYTEALQGEIKFNTSINLGTTFLIKIPVSHVSN